MCFRFFHQKVEQFSWGLRLLSLAAWLVLLVGCASSTPDPGAAFRGKSCAQIYQGGEETLKHKKYSKAIKHFEALDSDYPFCAYAEQADMHLIYAYFENGDVASAAAAADRFIRLYPRSPHVDYAFYMKGLSNFEEDRGWFQKYFPTDISQRDPGCARQSFADFAMLIRMFPDSCYAPDARQHMVFLRNWLATYELHIARYYFRRAAYVASVNRANYIVQHFDGTCAVPCALAILVQSYTALHMPELAAQANAVLQYNFPNSR